MSVAAAMNSANTEVEALEQKSVLRDYAETILICVIFVIFSRAFVFQQSKIPSGSMMDTLLVGDYIMVNRFIYSPQMTWLEKTLLPVRDIRRGDIVVFKKPDLPEIDYIKRVAGLPGDTVELRRGVLYVNGDRIDEPYVEQGYRKDYQNFGPKIVTPGNYFVLGDHRNASSDSRTWGEVPRRLIKGRALLIWWSFEEDPYQSPYVSLPDRLRSWGQKIAHFFTGTRWSRCFKLIR
jgi:signal peptidase I